MRRALLPLVFPVPPPPHALPAFALCPLRSSPLSFQLIALSGFSTLPHSNSHAKHSVCSERTPMLVPLQPCGPDLGSALHWPSPDPGDG